MPVGIRGVFGAFAGTHQPLQLAHRILVAVSRQRGERPARLVIALPLRVVGLQPLQDGGQQQRVPLHPLHGQVEERRQRHAAGVRRCRQTG